MGTPFAFDKLACITLCTTVAIILIITYNLAYASLNNPTTKLHLKNSKNSESTKHSQKKVGDVLSGEITRPTCRP